MTMTSQLRSWAQALGGDVSGLNVICPGPGHSARDRSLSVTPYAEARDEFVINSFAGDDWRLCRAYVRSMLGLPAFAPPQKPSPGARRGAPGHSGEPAKAATRPPDNARKAAWLWGIREPVSESCPAGLYLRQTRRYGGPIPPTLGYLHPNGEHPPAVIAAFGYCEEPEPGVIDPPAIVAGVHITRLTPDGGKASIDPVKVMLGAMSGLPIVLAPVNDGLGLAITEGIEDGLSVFEETGLGVWAAGSAGNMPKIVAALPPYVECTTIFAHRDERGMQFSKEAARLIAAMGTEVHIKGRG
jgi:Toprim domain